MDKSHSNDLNSLVLAAALNAIGRMKPKIHTALIAVITVVAIASWLDRTKTIARSLPARAYDPFSDGPPSSPKGAKPGIIRIQSSFIQCGSTTEELSFDWIIPFPESDNSVFPK